MFHWSPDYSEESELEVVPVWIVLPSLPPNFYHESFLKNITMTLGKYVHRDNCTRCASHTDNARVCIEINIANDPIDSFWIGMPHQKGSFIQYMVYKTLSTYCRKCLA